MNIRSFFEQSFPPACLLCQAPDGPLCEPCLADLPWAPKAGLKGEARKKNLRGAFQRSQKIAGLQVGIVDDVMMTGSTLDALAETLKRAGDAEVSRVVVARA